jgi:hypothetical protein
MALCHCWEARHCGRSVSSCPHRRFWPDVDASTSTATRTVSRRRRHRCSPRCRRHNGCTRRAAQAALLPPPDNRRRSDRGGHRWRSCSTRHCRSSWRRAPSGRGWWCIRRSRRLHSQWTTRPRRILRCHVPGSGACPSFLHRSRSSSRPRSCTDRRAPGSQTRSAWPSACAACVCASSWPRRRQRAAGR